MINENKDYGKGKLFIADILTKLAARMMELSQWIMEDKCYVAGYLILMKIDKQVIDEAKLNNNATPEEINAAINTIDQVILFAPVSFYEMVKKQIQMKFNDSVQEH